MSKVIKVDDKVYDQLDKLRDPGETFSRVIEQILIARGSLFNMFSALEGQLKFRKWQEQNLKDLQDQLKPGAWEKEEVNR